MTTTPAQFPDPEEEAEVLGQGTAAESAAGAADGETIGATGDAEASEHIDRLREQQS
ncbi:hypothetical protein [Citricoccus muralis]|uniref:Uncharacterized protein n=1 Tax=Citricoccus muralis TaxID=169134 RepID=A0A3D9LDH7_9MICC|nr:hypothetical protein [Citricoccus muralis]REE03724.1 hypothetical protein C8E99_1541 [Citricoccus muralis]